MTSQKQRIAEQTAEWAKADVGTVSSFANMEGLLKREYYGRFIIELIQNARDAWYASEKEAAEKSVVRLILHGDHDRPVLTVCNQGLSFNADRLLKHITQFGESSKTSGEGIGHKGIGFKSVLEITRTPEIYSREDTTGPFTLQVCFNPDKSEQLLNEYHEKPWHLLVQEYDGKGLKNKQQRLPILRFPHWIEKTSDLVAVEANWQGTAFNTLIRLPYNPEFDSILGITRDEWLSSVRKAMGDITDEIVMLLDAFDQVIVEDRLAEKTTSIKASRELPCKIGDSINCQLVTVTRNETESSRWLLYRKLIGGDTGKDLSHEITIGIQCQEENGVLIPCLRDKEEGEKQAPRFHLFFPTRIDSKLPFLFHAYFEVDAGRTRFAPDAELKNNYLLERLRELFISVIENLIQKDQQGRFSLLHLPCLFQAVDGVPDDLVAQNFREKLLAALDALPWVKVKNQANRNTATLFELLHHKDPDISKQLAAIFSPGYTWEQTNLLIPHNDLDDDGLRFLAGRLGEQPVLKENTLKQLLMPAEKTIWLSDENRRFVQLLKLLRKLQAFDGDFICELIRVLRTTDESRIIPTPVEGHIQFSPLPPETKPGKGRSDLAIFARLKQKSNEDLEPPASLKVAFVQDGILNDSLLSGPGRLLGIREYTMQAILDRLPAKGDYEDQKQVLSFIWQLLLKEDLSHYGVKSVLGKFNAFSPGNWWWGNPERDVDPDELRRIRALNHIRLPARDGKWVAAEKLVFGKEWADRLASLSEFGISQTLSLRKESFCDLEQLSPAESSILASPKQLADILPLPSIKWEDQEASPLPEDSSDRHFILMFCFLQRLGVWEIIPVKAFSNRTVREVKDPWHNDSLRQSQWKAITSVDYKFNRYDHQNIFVKEDFDWVWQIQGNKEFLNSLERACPFYSKLTHIKLFCSGCQTHKTWYENSPDVFQPSLLLWRLLNEQWLPCTIGDGDEKPFRPVDAWWESNIPDLNRMRTSPVRFLPMARSLTAETTKLCKLKSLESIGLVDIHGLLAKLRNDYETGNIHGYSPNGSSFRQAFIGLHQRLYSRLRKLGNKDETFKIIYEVGVLCEYEGLLQWRTPDDDCRYPDDCRYDDGKYAAYKHRFIDDIAFCALSRSDEDSAVAKFMRIQPFNVSFERFDNGDEKDVTADCDIHLERLTELFALLVHYRIGSRPLSPDSKDFTERLQRIKNLKIFQVEDLHLKLSVKGASVTKDVGQGNSGDLYLDRRKPSRPIIFHDYTDQDWPDLLCAKLAPFIAELVENMAYEDAISLLYQCPQNDLPYFLNKRGIADPELDSIRSAIGQSDEILFKQAKMWWTALLQLLEIPCEQLPEQDSFVTASILIQKNPFTTDFKEKLLRYQNVEHAREDTEGILEVIESGGYSLEKFHQLLLKQDSPGLTIRNAKRLFSEWFDSNYKELAYTLNKLGCSEDQAKRFGREWEIPQRFCFRVKVSLVEIMDSFALDLNKLTKNKASVFVAEALARDPVHHLASICDVSVEDLAEKSKLLYNTEEQKRISQNNYSELKRRLGLFITAIKTVSSTSSFRIREIHDEVTDQIASCPDVAAIMSTIQSLCGDNAGYLTLYVERLLKTDPLLELPSQSDMQSALADTVEQESLAHIQRVISRENRHKTDKIRRRILDLKKACVDFKPYQGPQTPQASKKKDATSIKHITKHHVKPKRQRHLKKLGVDAEEWVVAALLQKLEKLWAESAKEYQQVLEELGSALEQYYEGPSIQKLLSAKDRALLPDIDADDRIDALAEFIHISKESDSFGCDVLAWLAPFQGDEPRPLFLEVKSDSDRKFNVSENEWSQAARIGSSYAFMVVLRGKNTVPQGFELLPNPCQLKSDNQLMLSPDGWIASYGR